ncbi:stress protein [Desulfonema ishimotonii]|uniref:Stress protein n=1 Tax=Desulfonema ishimotonii TaxID=45657 RepID=A0A401G010_9BACT|nr:type I restriction enzyme HsdR N-terminal domain-containing protein [Desulfonema ishimotonii]GBC62526.1 stress protein [Desulfonema ishimotonii]
MWTKCTNEDCGMQFKVSDDKFAQTVTCKKCGQEFKALFCTEPAPTVDVLAEAENQAEETEAEATENTPRGKRKRKSPKEIMAEKIADIREDIPPFLPQIETAIANKDNESDTRLILDRIIQDVLKYHIEDIKTEQKIQGRKADYVLSADGRDVLVIEAKRISMTLNQRQVFQASAYGAYSGIKWVLLTNAAVWQLYRISTTDKVETDLVFSIDLRDGLNKEEAQYIYLISKDGMRRKGLLDNLWQKISALCYENILNAILADGVISKIRTTLVKDTGCKLANDEVRAAIEKNVFQID